MSIGTFYNKKATIKRLVGEDPADTETYQDVPGEIDCLIYPLDESFGQDLSGVYGKDYIMICGIHDIFEKDKIIDDEGLEYIVVGSKSYGFLGTELMELRIKQMPEAEES